MNRSAAALVALALAAHAPAAGPIEAAALPAGRAVTYEADVAPLFAAKCVVCHAGKVREGEFALDTHAGVMKGGKRGPAVVPGKPNDSFLWTSSSHRVKPVMPPKSEDDPLTEVEVAVLKRWIEQGAKGPAAGAVKALAAVALALPPAAVVPVRAVAVSPDKKLVAAGRGNRVVLLDAKSANITGALADPKVLTPAGKPAGVAHLSLVESMAFSPDGKLLATGSFREVVLWDVASGAVKRRVEGFADRVVAVAFSPDGKLLATGGGAPSADGEVTLVDVAGSSPPRLLVAAHSDTAFGVAFSPDGKLLATAGADKLVKLWTVADGKLAKSFEGHTHHVMDVAFTPDGKRLMSAGADNLLKIWDRESGEKVKDVQAHTKQVTRLAAAPKANQLLSASGDGTVKVWTGDNLGQGRTYADGKEFVCAVAASADGTVVVAGGEDGVVRVYDGAAGKLVKAVAPR